MGGAGLRARSSRLSGTDEARAPFPCADHDARSGRCEAPLDWSQVDETGLPLMRFTPTL